MLALSIHADYACRHSGRCCSTAWDVPAETDARSAIESGIAAGRLPMLAAFEAGVPPAEYAGVLRKGADGACVWLDRETRLCTVHARLGAAALPATCRLFPRIARTGPRGVAITLSHYCPTAARLLLREDVPLTVVEYPTAFPAGAYEGLEADEWPPLLGGRVLMDDEGFEAWEALLVSRCAAAPTMWTALAAMRQDAAALAAWRPGEDALTAAVRRRARVPVEAADPPGATWVRSRAEDAWGVSPGARPFDGSVALDPALRALAAFDGPARRFLAGHAFASWCAYQGRGIAAHVRGVETAAAVLVLETARALHAVRDFGVDAFLDAVAAADFLLRHQAPREDLAALWSRREGLS